MPSAAPQPVMTLRDRAGLYACAILLRLVVSVAFPALPDLLTGRVEISTPVTSFKRCQFDTPEPRATSRHS